MGKVIDEIRAENAASGKLTGESGWDGYQADPVSIDGKRLAIGTMVTPMVGDKMQTSEPQKIVNIVRLDGKADCTLENGDTWTANNLMVGDPLLINGGHKVRQFVNIENIPQDLKSLKQWVVWRLEPKADSEKMTKMPYQAKGNDVKKSKAKKAASNRPNEWVDFEQAVRFYRANKWATGLGLMFGNGVAGIDLDDKAQKVISKDGEPMPWAMEIIERMSSYAERSQSGKGLHILCYATLPDGRRRDDKLGIEMYDHKAGRFFVMTGDVLPGYETMEHRQDELTAVHGDYLPAKEKPKSKPMVDTTPLSLDDETLLDKARNSNNGSGEKFRALYDHGDLLAHPSQSEADLDLCGKLAWWTGKDSAQMDRLFRRSQLMREKWDVIHRSRDQATYGQMTIETAIDGTNGVYTGGGRDDDGLFDGFNSVADTTDDDSESVTDFDSKTKRVQELLKGDATLPEIAKKVNLPVAQVATIKSDIQKADEDLTKAALALLDAGNNFQWVAKQLGVKPGVIATIRKTRREKDETPDDFPKLPASARLDPDMGRDGCPWLDEFADYSRKWASVAYDDYHIACGIFGLATVAANRVHHFDGGMKHTALYQVMHGRSGMFTKSTAAENILTLLEDAHLYNLMAPDDLTPPQLIASMSVWIPEEYAMMDESSKDKFKRKIAFAGQQGWYNDEIGGDFEAMINKRGVKAEWRTYLRKLYAYNPKRAYRNETKTAGKFKIERPYLSLLAACTPADLTDVAQKGSKLWSDGFLARFCFVSHSIDDEPKKAMRPEDEIVPPNSLVNALISWHNRLGIPQVEIYESEDNEGNPNGHYTFEIYPPPGDKLRWERETKKAAYEYHWAMLDLLGSTNDYDTDHSLVRQMEKAQKVAALFASLEGSPTIEMRHWVKAQGVAEMWRFGLYKTNVLVREGSNGADLSDKLQAIIIKHQNDKVTNGKPKYAQGMTLNDVCRFIRSAGKDTEKRSEIYDTLETMVSFRLILTRKRNTAKKTDVYYHPTRRRKVDK